MTTVNYLSPSQMKKRTGMNTLGYSDPKNDEILLAKGMPKALEMKVREHEFEHITKGEEGPFPLAAVMLGGSVLSGIFGSKSAKKAANAQTAAAQAGINEQRRQYDTTREDLAPYRNIGNQALNALGSIYGYSPYSQGGDPVANRNSVIDDIRDNWGIIRDAGYYDAINWDSLGLPGGPGAEAPQPIGTNAFGATPVGSGEPSNPMSGPMSGPDYSQFFMSPDYQFRRDEGMRDIGNSFAARGGAASGNALRALAQYNSGLASGEFGNYFNRQAALAGIGQTATNATSQAGQNMAANNANLLGQAGNARASGILGRNAAVQNALGGAIDAWYNRGRTYDNSQVGPWGW